MKRKNLTSEEKAEKQLDIKLKLLSALFNILVFVGIGFCAFVSQKYIECIILLIAFISLRYTYPTTYHSKSFWLCLVWSIMIFVFALPNVLPIYLSLLFGVVIGCIVDLILYKIQENIDNNDKIGSLIAKLKEYQNIDLYKMSETELRQYGASRGLSELQQDIIVMRVIEHLKISEICRYRNYGRTTIKYHIAQIKQKLDIETI